MSTITISDSQPPIQHHDITAIEQQLGIQLPSDYRTFLLAHNGGHPEPNTFPIQSFYADQYGLLEWFVCISPNDPNDLAHMMSTFHDRIPSNVLTIARDPGGNLLCMALTGANLGTVYYWDHEEESPEDTLPTYDNMYFVAPNFTALLQSLTTLPQ